MTKKTLLTAAILISFAAPALADQYYIVRGPDRHCTVTTTKPTEQTTVTQIGPLAFESREKAEDRIKTTKGLYRRCNDRGHSQSKKSNTVSLAEGQVMVPQLALLSINALC